jgi:hypothetical protein
MNDPPFDREPVADRNGLRLVLSFVSFVPLVVNFTTKNTKKGCRALVGEIHHKEHQEHQEKLSSSPDQAPPGFEVAPPTRFR